MKLRGTNGLQPVTDVVAPDVHSRGPLHLRPNHPHQKNVGGMNTQEASRSGFFGVLALRGGVGFPGREKMGCLACIRALNRGGPLSSRQR